MAKMLSKFGEQHLVMVNYACGFNQSETGKYFEWIIIIIIVIITVVVIIITVIFLIYVIREFTKRIGDDLPFYYWRANEG